MKLFAKSEFEKQRILAGLTQQKLGELVNLSDTHISQLEKAIEPASEKSAKRIADFFNLTIEDLFEIRDVEDK